MAGPELKAALLCAVAQRYGARCVIVSAEQTPSDDEVDAVIGRPIGEVLPEIVALAAHGPKR